MKTVLTVLDGWDILSVMTGLFGQKAVFALLVAVLLVVNVGGIFSAGMMDDSAMQDCPYMSIPALCTMNPLAHLSQWQQMFTTTVQHMTTAVLLLLLALAVVWYFLQDLCVPKRTEAFTPRYRDKGRVFDPLRLAFARGVLHSKAF